MACVATREYNKDGIVHKSKWTSWYRCVQCRHLSPCDTLAYHHFVKHHVLGESYRGVCSEFTSWKFLSAAEKLNAHLHGTDASDPRHVRKRTKMYRILECVEVLQGWEQKQTFLPLPRLQTARYPNTMYADDDNTEFHSGSDSDNAHGDS